MLVKLSNATKKNKNKNIQMLKMMKKIKNARNLINTKKSPGTSFIFDLISVIRETLWSPKKHH